jgi:hypothetical protein
MKSSRLHFHAIVTGILSTTVAYLEERTSKRKRIALGKDKKKGPGIARHRPHRALHLDPFFQTDLFFASERVSGFAKNRPENE